MAKKTSTTQLDRYAPCLTEVDRQAATDFIVRRLILKDPFVIADEVIREAYPDIYSRGNGWWGDQRIPNWGILRGAIARAITSQQSVQADAVFRLQCVHCGGYYPNHEKDCCVVIDRTA